MSTVAEKLHKWSIQELNLVSEGGLNGIPDVDSLRILTKGKNKKIWTYVINHVRSESTVNKVKRILSMKKQLKEKEENVTFCTSNSVDYVELQTAVSKAAEKRKYLMRSLSTIEERILKLEQNVKKTKDEIFQVKQKTALLEHLKYHYNEKNSNLRRLFSEICSYKNSLSAYQSAKMCDNATVAFPCDFLFESRTVYDETSSRVKELIMISSSILKKNFNHDDENISTLIEKFQKNITEFKKHDILLTDIVILLKEMSSSDLQKITALHFQNSSVKEYLQSKRKQDYANDHLTNLKYDNIHNALCAKKSKKEIEKILVVKENMRQKMTKSVETDLSKLDYEMKCLLYEKCAENYALTVSNDYLENYLKSVASKSETILKKIRQKTLCRENLSSVVQTFHDDADLTYYLLYTVHDSIKKAVNILCDLSTFAHKEIFELPFPQKECLEELKDSFACDRKLTWNYCDNIDLIKSLFPEPLIDSSFSADVKHSLHIQPFQSISTLCESWTCFKQKLRVEVAANTEACVTNTDVNVLEIYSNFLKVLENMKISIDNGMLFASDGIAFCHKTKSLIQEWWDQNAQYIPHIEYGGKTLKMWIDILSVLSDFEPQNYA